ncbi:WD40 repeat domain-containing protein [Nostoc sp.]|uniref:WD40 repeat domain-containing protein n=1 Tax=Nostoc sp. TaxID=1180 RepID=UPI003FA58E03
MAAATGESRIKLWNVLTGECIHNLQDHTGRVWLQAISYDNAVLASCSDDQTVRLWDIHIGECLSILQADNSSVNSVLFSHFRILSAKRDYMKKNLCLNPLHIKLPYNN